MFKLSPTQQRILEAASKSPEEDIRSFMEDLRSPAIREQVLNSLQQKGMITANEGNQSFLISEEGLKAVSAEAGPSAIPQKDNSKKSKQDIIIAMLKSEEGTTIEQIIQATGWQRHSVYGYLSGTLKKSKGLTIASTKEQGEKRFYKIV